MIDGYTVMLLFLEIWEENLKVILLIELIHLVIMNLLIVDGLLQNNKQIIKGVIIPHINISGYDSVTQIVDILDKPYLRLWHGKLGNKKCDKILSDSQVTGSMFHDLVYCHLAKIQSTEYKGKHTKQVIKMFDSIKLNYLDKYEIKPIWIEKTFKDDNLMIQGTADLYEEHRVTDWKTSSSINDTAVLQLCYYAYLYNLNTQQTWENGINQGRIVRIDKKTYKVQVRDYINLNAYWSICEALKIVYNWYKKKGIWNSDIQ